jgi:RHS repeat-associated protein
MAGAWGELGIWNYNYAAGNERVEAQGPADGSRRVYFYDVTGELLGEYSVLVDGPGKLYSKQERMRVSFAGRPLELEDRLGSKVVGPIDQQTGQATRYRYYPYGQNIGTNVGWDDVQFATYTRDGATGLDYARNRYYTRTWGRFLSPDPYVASGGPADPGSWNRYAYVQGDPVNWTDEAGLFRHCPRGDGCRVDTDPFYDSQNGGAETRIVGPESNTGRGGGGSGRTRTNQGIDRAAKHLETIASEAFRSKPKCNDFLEALIAVGGLSVDATTLSKQIAQTAMSASSVVYDGPSSNTALSDDKFPGLATAGLNTVADWFAYDAGRKALSQYNGAAIWVRSSDWADALGGLVASAYAGRYGLGTMMHELLHKASVGGGFGHDQMANALKQIGVLPGDYTLGRNAISDQIGRICF